MRCDHVICVDFNFIITNCTFRIDKLNEINHSWLNCLPQLRFHTHNIDIVQLCQFTATTQNFVVAHRADDHFRRTALKLAR